MIDSALSRWLDALHALGEASFVAAAFAPDATLLRFGWTGDEQPKESFSGHEAISGWLARSPKGIRFTHEAPARADGAFTMTYTITMKDFSNQGSWRVILAPDGRIAHLEHHPNPL